MGADVALSCLAQLERCHRRHDEVMSELLEAARRFAAGRPESTDLECVRDAVAYFERSVRRHFLDEEGSVFPRLSTRRPELAAELAALSAEHPTQVELQARVATAVAALDGGTRPSAGKELLDAAVALAEAHTVHVGREDALFQIAQAALTAEDDAEISAEMETRRDREDGGGRRRGGGGGGGGGGDGGGGGGGRGRRDNRQMSILPVGDPIEVIDPSRSGEDFGGGTAGPADPTVDLAPVARTKRVTKAKPKARAAKTVAKRKPPAKPAKKRTPAKPANKPAKATKPKATKPKATKPTKPTKPKATKPKAKPKRR